MDNELTKKPIPGLIKKIAIPASIGFFFNTMYNVIDTFYAGLINTEAVAALSLSFPVFFIIIAMGSGISTGVTALIANSLGGKDKREKLFAAQSISFTIIASVVLSFVGLIVAKPLFKLLGAQGNYLDVSLSYINIIFYGTIFFILNHVLNSGLQARGDTKTLRNTMVIGFIMNLILDPWFIYGGFGVPAMGVAGVAIATVLIQFLITVYMTYKVIKVKVLDKTCWQLSKPRKDIFLEISKQGFPAGLNMMTVALGIFIITFFVSKFGQAAVAAYGIATRIEQIALLPTIGLNIATLSLVGQNNGAKLYDRIRETLKKSLDYGLSIMIIGTIAVYIFAKELMLLFTKDIAVVEYGETYLKIAVFIFFAYIYLFVNTSALQGVKKPMFALWIGLYRQLIGPMVIYSIFSNIWGINGIWYGVFLITWTSAIISIWYTKRTFKKLHIE